VKTCACCHTVCGASCATCTACGEASWIVSDEAEATSPGADEDQPVETVAAIPNTAPPPPPAPGVTVEPKPEVKKKRRSRKRRTVKRLDK